jgi:hypothetical protein
MYARANGRVLRNPVDGEWVSETRTSLRATTEGRHGPAACVSRLDRSLILRWRLRLDQDHAVGPTQSIHARRDRILQNFNGCNVGRHDTGQIPAGAGLKRDAFKHVQRLLIRRYRRRPANADTKATVGGTCNPDAGELARHCLVERRARTALNVFRRHDLFRRGRRRRGGLRFSRACSFRGRAGAN